MGELDLIQIISENISPFVAIMIAVIITLWLRDFFTKIVKGISFKLNAAFKEGDKVILDDEEALIVRVGFTQTVFGIVKPSGEYCWRYVPNERIIYAKLEKIILEESERINGRKTKQRDVDSK